MAKPIMVTMEQFHLTILVPRGLSRPKVAAIRRTLHRAVFGKHLRRAIHAALGCYPALTKTRFTITR